MHGLDKDGNVVETSSSGKAGPIPTYTPSTMKYKSTTLHIEVDAPNKLVSGAPAINYDVKVKLSQGTDGNFSYQISGQRDGFPAYEFFITNEATGKTYMIYGSTPAQTGETSNALFPPMEKKIKESGNSEYIKPVE